MHPRVPAVIELHNITVQRGDTRVFDRLSLCVERGEHVAVLGPNGAGKTTLLRLLSRELYPQARDDSHVRLFGDERASVWELRARLGILSGDLQRGYDGAALGLHVVLSGFYSSIGVWHHQTYAAEQIVAARALLERFGIGHLATRNYGSLSTGEQRRLLLARALIHDPELLVLDEPTSGLDLQAGFQYLALVRDLMRAGKTVVLVTHHIHEIPPEIGRVILLRAGRVLADGRKPEVLTAVRLRETFDVDLELVERHGWYQALPAA